MKTDYEELEQLQRETVERRQRMVRELKRMRPGTFKYWMTSKLIDLHLWLEREGRFLMAWSRWD